jgi:hypothetical protein
MPKKGKICLFKTYYMLILTNGAETWAWTKANISRSMTAEMRFLNIKGKLKEREKWKIVENLQINT